MIQGSSMLGYYWNGSKSSKRAASGTRWAEGSPPKARENAHERVIYSIHDLHLSDRITQ